MKVMIPMDLTRRIARRKIARIVIFLLLICLLLLLFVFFKPIAQLAILNKVLTFILCVILIAAITGIPFKVIGRSWQGEVLDVKVRTSTDSFAPLKPAMETWFTANTVIVTLKTPKGNIIRKEAEKIKAKYSQPKIDTYDKGDYVVHLFGAKFVAHLKPNSDQLYCVLCGLKSPSGSDKCAGCGCGLIRFISEE